MDIIATKITLYGRTFCVPTGQDVLTAVHFHDCLVQDSG